MTLVERAVEHALGARLLDVAAVSTDDIEIERLVERLPVEVIRRRCGPDGPMVDVLRDALEQVGGDWDAVVTVQPTSPLRTSEDIDGCIRHWVDNPSFAVVSVDEMGNRNGAVYISPVSLIRAGEVFRGDGEDLGYEMPDARSLDINLPVDLAEARIVLGA